MKLPTKIVTGAVSTALLVAAPFVAKWEGLRTEPYADIGGVKTVCYGETRVPMRGYTPDECRLMLEKALREYYLPESLDAAPTLAEKPGILAMVGSFSYNLGVETFRASSARKHFVNRNWEAGCQALTLYDKVTYSKPQAGKTCTQKKDGRWACTVKGLQNRRNAELEICLKAI